MQHGTTATAPLEDLKWGCDYKARRRHLRGRSQCLAKTRTLLYNIIIEKWACRVCTSMHTVTVDHRMRPLITMERR